MLKNSLGNNVSRLKFLIAVEDLCERDLVTGFHGLLVNPGVRVIWLQENQAELCLIDFLNYYQSLLGHIHLLELLLKFLLN